MSANQQLFALRTPPPAALDIAGRTYRLAMVFKHDFFAATCLYDSPAGKAVVKFGRDQAFCGLPLAWLGELNCRHERAVYARLADVPGIPRWLATLGPTSYAIEYIDGRQLDQGAVPPGFFEQVRRIFDALHARDIAYVDANKRSNILVGPHDQAFLIDYQISFLHHPDLPWPLRALSRRILDYFIQKDLYHLYKHKRRLAPHELTPQEDELSRRRTFFHRIHRALTKPYRDLRRGFLRKQYSDGRLVSSTQDLEQAFRQPEKETWRHKEN